MNNNNVKQEADVCPASRETWQALQFFTTGLQTCSQNKDSTKSLCIWQMGNKTFVLFWGYGWERIENISAENAQKHLSNFERNEDVIRGLFLFPLAIPAEHKGAAERMHETVVWKREDLDFLFFFFCPGSAVTFPNLSPSSLPASYYNVEENFLQKVRVDLFCFLKLRSMGYFPYHRSLVARELIRIC